MEQKYKTIQKYRTEQYKNRNKLYVHVLLFKKVTKKGKEITKKVRILSDEKNNRKKKLGEKILK